LINRILLIAVALASLLPGAAVRAEEGNLSQANEFSHFRTLREADRAISQLDTDRACDLWFSLLDGPATYSSIALYRLLEWTEECGFGDRVDRIERMAMETQGTARHIWRFRKLAARLLKKFGKAERAKSLEPLRLPVSDTRWIPATAPIFLTFAGMEAPVPDRPPAETPGTGMVASLSYCFEVSEPSARYVKLELPNPSIVFMNGSVLDTIGPDAGQVFPQTRFAALLVNPGTHCIKVLQAAANSPEEALLELIPAGGISPLSTREEGGIAAWERVPQSVACVEADYVCDWFRISEDRGRQDRLVKRAETALESASDLMLYIALLRSPTLHSGATEGDELEILASYVSTHDDCLPQLELARLRLDVGEDRQAEAMLRRLGQTCRETAAGIMLTADFVQTRQWMALYDEQLELAKERFGDNCDVLTRWYYRQLEQGIYVKADSLPVACKEVNDAETEFLVRSGASEEELPPEEFVKRFQAVSRGRRLRMLSHLIDPEKNKGMDDVLDRLVRDDPYVAWELADLLLARGRRSQAEQSARLATRHNSAWGPMRSQAGKVFFWNSALSLVKDHEQVISDYLDSDFASGMPQVVVLDELIALPDGNGWVTLVETVVSHMVSPDAAESVGEVSLGSDEEILELAVRKSDGTYVGPENMAEAAHKDTISLPGLAPGDFVIKRTIREYPAGTGSCYALPPFYFGHREYPVFLARYVMVEAEGQELDIVTQGSFDRVEEDGAVHLFQTVSLEPVPEEAMCPDREAGVAFVYAYSSCYDWSTVRNTVSDGIGGFCNAPLPAALPPGRRSPAQLLHYVAENIEGEESGLFEAPFSELLQSGRGNRVLALYCALIQAGHDAHMVALNTPAARPIDYGRPAWSYFDQMVVYVPGDRPVWLDPYDRLAPASYLRPMLRGRVGLVLTPMYPRLFITTPEEQGGDLWKARISGELDDQGRLAGELALEGMGLPAVELDVSVRNATDMRKKKMVQAILNQFLPAGVAQDYEYEVKHGSAILHIRFAMQLDRAADGRLLLMLPPSPPGELTQLATRKSPLYFPGFLPTDIRVELSAAGDYEFVANEVDLTAESKFGSVHLLVGKDGSGVELEKTAAAKTTVVAPADYASFVEFLSRTGQLSAVSIGVVHEERR